jgi:flagellin-specific chaperone FliS
MMHMLSRNPAAAYRRVALEARIEASGSADLTRICLEEAQAALGQALIALDRSLTPPREPLTRAQTIMLWLAQSVAPGHPLGSSLKAFYGGLAGQIGANLLQADAASLARIQSDIRDILQAAG